MAEGRTVAAPGSVLLLGEYAVTEPDGPGVAMAIDPQVRATLTPGGSPRILGRMGARRFTWTPKRCDSPLFAALVAECGPPAGTITVDSTEFAGPHGKLGLGSSAAVVVAVAALLAEPRQAAECASASGSGESGASSDDDAGGADRSEAGRIGPRGELPTGGAAGRDAGRRRVFAAALAAHRAAQGGRGSGYDVATSVWGGVVQFSGGRTPHALPHRSRALPALYLVQGAAPLETPAALARYREWRQREPDAANRFVLRSREVVEQFLAADDATACCAAIFAGGELIRWLGARIGVAVEPPELRRRLDRLRARGWAAKPVGAGGELGIAAAPAGTRPPDVPDGADGAYALPLRPAEGVRRLDRSGRPAGATSASRLSSPVPRSERAGSFDDG